MDAGSLDKPEPSALFPAVSAFIHDLIKVDATASGLLSDLARVETETYSLLRNQNMSISPAALQLKWNQLVSQIQDTVARVNRLRPEALIPQHFSELKGVIQSVHSKSPFTAAAKKEHNQSFMQLKKELVELDALIETGAESLSAKLTKFKNDFSVKYNAFFQTAQISNDARAKAIRDIRRLVDVILRLLSDEKKKTQTFVAPVECRILSKFFDELRVKADKSAKPRAKTPPPRTPATGSLLGSPQVKPTKRPAKDPSPVRSKTPPPKRGSLSQIPKRIIKAKTPTSSTLKSEPKIKTSSSLAKVPKVVPGTRNLGSTLPRPASGSAGTRTGTMMSKGISGSLTSMPARQKTPPNTKATTSATPTKVSPPRAVSPGVSRPVKSASQPTKATPMRPKSPSFSKTAPSSALRTVTKSPSAKTTPSRTRHGVLGTATEKRTPAKKEVKATPESTLRTKKHNPSERHHVTPTEQTPPRQKKPENPEPPSIPAVTETPQDSKSSSERSSPVQTSTPPRRSPGNGSPSSVTIVSPPEEGQPLARIPTSESLDSETDQLVLAVTKAREQARGKSATLDKLQRDLSGDFFSAETEPRKDTIPEPTKQPSPSSSAQPNRRSPAQTPSPTSWKSESKSPSPVRQIMGGNLSPGDVETRGNSEKEKEAYLRAFKSFETRLMAFEPVMLAGKKINEFVALTKKQGFDTVAASALLSEIDEMISGMSQLSPNGQRLYNAAKALAQLNRLIEIDIAGKFVEPNSKTMKDAFRSVEKILTSVQDPKLQGFVSEQIERLKSVKPQFQSFLEAQTKRENVQRMRQENEFLEQDLERIRTNISLVKGAGAKMETFDIAKVDKMNHSELTGASQRLTEELAEIEKANTEELASLSSMYSKTFKKRNEFIHQLTVIHKQVSKLHEVLAASNNAETVMVNNVATPRDEVMAKLEALFQRGEELSQLMESS